MTDLDIINKKLDKLLATQKDVFTIEEAANYIGLSKAYLYKLTSRNAIPFYKPNKKIIYFDKLELNTWLKQNPQKTITQIESEASDYLHLKR